MVDQHKTITYPGAFDAIVSVGRPSGTQFQRESNRPVAESGLGHKGNHEWDTFHVITEHALLPVMSGAEDEFEIAFEEARVIITSIPGCRWV
jgi:hypothetical protein